MSVQKWQLIGNYSYYWESEIIYSINFDTALKNIFHADMSLIWGLKDKDVVSFKNSGPCEILNPASYIL